MQPKTRLTKSHTCEWRAQAAVLEEQLRALNALSAEQAKRLAELERLFKRRSEKQPKLAPVQKPKRTAIEAKATRNERAAERVVRMETVVEEIAVPAAEKHCAVCGDTAFTKFSAGKTSEVVSYVQGYFRKVVYHRETCKCQCGKTLVTAPAPARWSSKTKYAASVASHLIVQKCAYSTPLYRLEAAFAQQGLMMPRSTMNDLLHRAAVTLEPLRKVLVYALREERLVHIDETSFNMTAQKRKKSYMWAFVGTKATLYDFSLSRAGVTPVKILGATTGFFVADDFSGYNQLKSLGGRIRCGCMAHTRRGFSEAGPVPEAELALALIQEIYAVEHEAKRLGVHGTNAHLVLRQARSTPAFIALMRLSHRIIAEHSPKTILGKAARYAWTNLRSLSEFLRDARIPPDNNIAENTLRIIALARKNYLFAHSEDAANGLALLYSLLASCKQNQVNPLCYFEDVLNRILDEKQANLRSLLPDRWTPKVDPVVG